MNKKGIIVFLIIAYITLACRVTSLEKKMEMVKESYNSTGKKLNF